MSQNGSDLDTALCHCLILQEQMQNPLPCHIFPNTHMNVYGWYNIFNQQYQLIYQYLSPHWMWRVHKAPNA